MTTTTSPPPPTRTAVTASVTGRAAVALSLLAGYFVLAAVVIGGLAWLTVLAVQGGAGVLGGKLGILTALVGVAVVRALFVVEKRGDVAVDDGVPAPRGTQPELWRLIDEVSSELGVEPPHDLWLSDDVNAYVRQETRLLGMVGGRRHMCLGTALLQVINVEELRAVVAHELGHYAGGDTRLSALVYRAGATVERTASQLGASALLGRLFDAYAGLYARVSLVVRRRQELRADEGAVRVAGREAHESALRAAHATAPAYQFFISSYVEPLWNAGTAPRDLFLGFRCFVDDPENAEQLARLRAEDGEPGDPYDSHPPLSTRIAYASAVPDRQAPADTRPARTLLLGADHVEESVTTWLNGRLLRTLPDRLYAFVGALDPAPYVAGLSEVGRQLSEATARVDGGPEPAGLGRTLTLLETGRDAELVMALTADRRDLGLDARREDLRGLVAGPLALAAAVAMVEAGGAAWRVTWSEVRELVGPGGEPLHLGVDLVEALEQGTPGLRETLLDHGAPLDDHAAAVAVRPADERNIVLAVWPEIRRGQRWFDAVVTAEQLLLVPQQGSWRMRLLRGLSAQYGLGKAKRVAHARTRVDALMSTPLPELAARPDVHVLVWDYMPQVRLKSGIANAWVLRFPGLDKPLDVLKADDLLVPPPAEVAELLRRLVGYRLESDA